MVVQVGDDHALAQRQAAIPVTMLARLFQCIRRQQFAQALRRRQSAVLATGQQVLRGRVGQGHLPVFGEQQQAFAQALKQGLQHRLRRKGAVTRALAADTATRGVRTGAQYTRSCSGLQPAGRVCDRRRVRRRRVAGRC
jgi:hypothetical protein